MESCHGSACAKKYLADLQCADDIVWVGSAGSRFCHLTAFISSTSSKFLTSRLYAEKLTTRGLCAVAQCESLRYKLIGGLAVRRACYGVLRFIMESQAVGCEVIVSGKLRGQRAKSMKFVDGLMIHSGNPVNDYIQKAVRHHKKISFINNAKVDHCQMCSTDAKDLAGVCD
ncbi:unnamed protein product [Soboliphyme baturini]|uniref:40S ribosomal protein S3 n=1 Tax=Soboliphyme baturini TaxID=241478 RepID=A0A3P8EIQ2_9BILA|nr:unnamed protein product [Soboliphyme baturini]